MKASWKLIGRWLGAFIGAVLFAIFLLVIGANTTPGRHLIAWLATPLSGGRIAVQGLGGRFPGALSADTVTLKDDEGHTWLVLNGVTVAGSLRELLFHNHLQATRLAVANASLLHLPVNRTAAGATFRIDLDAMRIERLQLGANLVGHDATFAIAGGVHYASLDDMQLDLVAQRNDAPGHYRVNGAIGPGILRGVLRIREPNGGLIGGLLRAPQLGAVAIDAQALGPNTADGIDIVLTAGALKAQVQGTIDLIKRRLDLRFEANAPAMNPAPAVSWQTIAANGSFRGAFDKPQIQFDARADQVQTGTAALRTLIMRASGENGLLGMHARAEGLRVPGRNPNLFSAAPLVLDLQFDRTKPQHPLSFVLSHSLISVTGHSDLAGDRQSVAQVNLPTLGPLAAAAGVDLQGHASFAANVVAQDAGTAIGLDGTVAIAGANPFAPLVGDKARLIVTASMAKDGVVIQNASLAGAAVDAALHGSYRGGQSDFDWTLVVNDLSRLAQTLSGRIAAHGSVQGATDNLNVLADANGFAASNGFAREPLRMSLRAQDVPTAPRGTLSAEGRFDQAPLLLYADFARATDGALRLSITRADWKSLRLRSDLMLRTKGASSGSAELHLARLSDLQSIIGESLSGRLDAHIEMTAGTNRGRLTLSAYDVSMRGAAFPRLNIDGTVANLLIKPSVALKFAAGDLVMDGIKASINGDADGTMDALKLNASATLAAGTEQAHATGTAVLDGAKQQLQLLHLDGTYRGQPIRLLQPAHFDYAKGLAVDRLQASIGPDAQLAFAGRVSPILAADATLSHATFDFIEQFVSLPNIDGTLSASAKLGGTLAKPEGTITLSGDGIRMRGVSTRAIPPAQLTANGTLHGQALALKANLDAGESMQLSLTGEVPLVTEASLALHAAGTANLAMLDPYLNARGQSVHGVLSLAANIAGTYAAPRIEGSGKFADGDVQDVLRGVHITDLAADLAAQGQKITVSNLSGHAGTGTIAGHGVIDLSAPGTPIDLSLTAADARPVANDEINAIISANLKLAGRLAEGATLSGDITINRGEILIPDRLPSQVAVLDVRRPGQKPPAMPERQPLGDIALNLDITAAQRLFVRGRGLDAEVGGKIHIGGTNPSPSVTGGFNLRRGDYSIAGRTLNFTSGKVTFEGSSLVQRIDPALDFAATTTSDNVTANLSIGGFASAPKLTLSSSPSLPQDEILARLLFGQSLKQLGPLQIAEIASALASLGAGGVGNPLWSIRRKLGLDRLAVSGGGGGQPTTVEAGKYVANGVYVGAKQGTAGATQALVQIDLTEHLKLQATASSANSTAPSTSPVTPETDNGSSIGLSYQFEY